MTDLDRAILTFEHQRWVWPGSKVQAISDQLGLSETRYYQRLVALLDDPEAWAAEPVLMGRLARRTGRAA